MQKRKMELELQNNEKKIQKEEKNITTYPVPNHIAYGGFMKIDQFNKPTDDIKSKELYQKLCRPL